MGSRLIEGRLQPPQHAAALRAVRSAETLPPLDYSYGDSSIETATPSPPQLHRHNAPSAKSSYSPSPLHRVRSNSVDLLTTSSGYRHESLHRIMSPPSTSDREDLYWPPRPASANELARTTKKRRLRIDSSATSLTPIGFPYRNAAPLLDADAAWSTSGGSDNGVREDDSSEDVDLDLSMDWDLARSMPHVGIDMGGERRSEGNSLAAPAVIRRSVSYDREGAADFGSGWSFNPTAPAMPPQRDEAKMGSLGRNSIRGLLDRALRSPTWSMVSGNSTSPPSRRGSSTTWTKSTTTAATTPRTPQCESLADEYRLDVVDDPPRSRAPSPRLPFRLINAFRDSQPPDAGSPTPTNANFPIASTAGLGIHNLLATPPGSPVPRVDISGPDESPDRESAHVRFDSTPVKQSSPRGHRPRKLQLSGSATKARPKSVDGKTAYKPLILLHNHRDGTTMHIASTEDHSPLSSPVPRSPNGGATTFAGRSTSPGSHSPTPSFEYDVEMDDRPWWEIASPAQTLFYAGWLLGPWCWLIGGFYLRYEDGEFAGSRGNRCRCARRGGSCEVACGASRRRAMRLRGVRDTGRGAKADAGEVVEIDAWVKANRTAGAVGGVVSAALFAVALQALVKAW